MDLRRIGNQDKAETRPILIELKDCNTKLENYAEKYVKPYKWKIYNDLGKLKVV